MKKITTLIGVSAILGGCASIAPTDVSQVENDINLAQGGTGTFGEYVLHAQKADCDAASAQQHLDIAKRYDGQLLGSSASHLAEAQVAAQSALGHRREADAVLAGLQNSWDNKLAALEARVAANEGMLNRHHDKMTISNAPTGTAIRMDGVQFAFNSNSLTSESEAYLDGAVPEILERGPNAKLEVAGHSDNTGSREYNISLSQQRADAVRDYLVSRGVSAENISATGYGPDSPVADNSTKEGRALNRRVELVLN
ncbi:MAG: OmpA family protein [Methylococcales bacterium]